MREKMNIPLFTIIGKPGSGKTTLLEKIITELKRRNYRVGTIKHHSHAGFDIDKPGKDSWRHAQAGSVHVIIAAPDKIASYRVLDRELTLDEIAADFVGVDIILAEGYRQAGKPTLEIVRTDTGLGFISNPEQRFAVATDLPLDVKVPRFELDNAEELVNLIVDRFLTKSNHEQESQADDLIQ